MTSPHQFLTVARAAELLNLSTRTIHRRIESGEIMAVRLGSKATRIPCAQLNNWSTTSPVPQEPRPPLRAGSRGRERNSSMPATRRKAADDAIVVCIERFSTAALPGSPACSAGTRLKATNPLVKVAPRMFLEDGASHEEIVAARQALYAEGFEQAEKQAAEFQRLKVEEMRD